MHHGTSMSTAANVPLHHAIYIPFIKASSDSSGSGSGQCLQRLRADLLQEEGQIIVDGVVVHISFVPYARIPLWIV